MAFPCIPSETFTNILGLVDDALWTSDTVQLYNEMVSMNKTGYRDIRIYGYKRNETGCLDV
jgi:hypothetical protein